MLVMASLKCKRSIASYDLWSQVFPEWKLAWLFNRGPDLLSWRNKLNATQTTQLSQSMTSDLMTSPEAAIYLRISQGTLQRWVHDRKIEFVKMGRTVRFRKAGGDSFPTNFGRSTRKVNHVSRKLPFGRITKRQSGGTLIVLEKHRSRPRMTFMARIPKSLKIKDVRYRTKMFPEICPSDASQRGTVRHREAK